MDVNMKFFTLLLAISLVSCNAQQEAIIETALLPDHEYIAESQVLIHSSGKTLVERIKVPDAFSRVEVIPGSFQDYLRTIPFKAEGTQVKYYNGEIKPNNNVYTAVIDLDIGQRDLHQCADAVMRLKAEYLWKSGYYDQIHFNFTNGFRVDYSEWLKGRRMIIDGNKTKWNNCYNPSNSYKDFWKYMELIFAYAGTASLEKELKSIDIMEMEIGDVFIQGGFPGHAVIVMDMAKNKETGEQLYLLAQSYMPAQELQILVNPIDQAKSPWYILNENEIIKTPEWTFSNNNLKRFQD
jgi:hypothetical protein